MQIHYMNRYFTSFQKSRGGGGGTIPQKNSRGGGGGGHVPPGSLPMDRAPIALETGRYQNVPCEERLCIICNSGNIEDEFHCFMSCSAYNYLRSQLFNVISNFDSSFSSLSLHQQFIIM